MPLTRLTVAAGESFEGERAAERWLRTAESDAEVRASLVRDATRLVNRGLAAMRAEARDPLIQDVGATRALRVVVGYGEGEDLAEGRWSEGRRIPPPRRKRLDDVDPLSRVASVLAGRDSVHPAETMLERARLDAQQGRSAEARLGLRAAREALAAGADERRAAALSKRIDAAERELGA